VCPISNKGSVRNPRAKLQTPSSAEISAYMRSLTVKRWKRYAERVARGEITADNYAYRPRGPMPPHSKTQQDFTRFEHQIAKARLVRIALEGGKLSPRMVEATLSRNRARLHLRFGGQPPKQWHSVHY
jgi:hypothetical protein